MPDVTFRSKLVFCTLKKGWLTCQSVSQVLIMLVMWRVTDFSIFSASVSPSMTLFQSSFSGFCASRNTWHQCRVPGFMTWSDMATSMVRNDETRPDQKWPDQTKPERCSAPRSLNLGCTRHTWNTRPAPITRSLESPSANVLQNILRETISLNIRAKYAAECNGPIL